MAPLTRGVFVHVLQSEHINNFLIYLHTFTLCNVMCPSGWVMAGDKPRSVLRLLLLLVVTIRYTHSSTTSDLTIINDRQTSEDHSAFLQLCFPPRRQSSLLPGRYCIGCSSAQVRTDGRTGEEKKQHKVKWTVSAEVVK
jgi:hypothetical protein